MNTRLAQACAKKDSEEQHGVSRELAQGSAGCVCPTCPSCLDLLHLCWVEASFQGEQRREKGPLFR